MGKLFNYIWILCEYSVDCYHCSQKYVKKFYASCNCTGGGVQFVLIVSLTVCVCGLEWVDFRARVRRQEREGGQSDSHLQPTTHTSPPHNPTFSSRSKAPPAEGLHSLHNLNNIHRSSHRHLHHSDNQPEYPPFSSSSSYSVSSDLSQSASVPSCASTSAAAVNCSDLRSNNKNTVNSNKSAPLQHYNSHPQLHHTSSTPSSSPPSSPVENWLSDQFNFSGTHTLI